MTTTRAHTKLLKEVLNLVISGIPSIHNMSASLRAFIIGFKPCYKWNTFNTMIKKRVVEAILEF